MMDIPNKPSESQLIRCFRSLPTMSVHHWKPLAEYVNTRELPTVENIGTSYAFEVPERKKHQHARHQSEGMSHEFVGVAVWRVGDYRLRIFARAFLL
jgi:hypothetical protein